MNTGFKNIISWLTGVVLLTVLDQYTKLQAVLHLKEQPSYVLLDGVFELLYSENRGAAFSMLQGCMPFFFAVALVVFVVAAYAMYRMPGWTNKRYHGLKICAILITAGAAGNLIDRVSQGYVVDFLYFSLINFPIFNVADIYVTVAAFILFLLLCFYYKDEELELFQFRKHR